MDGKILNIVLAAGMAVLAATTIVTALSAQKREKQLLSVIESLKNSPGSEKTPEASETEPEKKTFTYLALGNSITKHGKCGYWWNECGMAASTAEKDYFHLVKAHLETEHDNVNATAYNFSAWEITAADRAQTLLTLEGYLSAKPDLITVQLSENVTDMTDFSGDFAYMLDWLAEKCPEAEIIVIDEFWNAQKSDIKRGICAEKKVAFADLSEIRGKKEYQSSMGAVVYGDDGQAHTVDHTGVSGHPGDSGMKYIADKVMSLIGKGAGGK